MRWNTLCVVAIVLGIHSPVVLGGDLPPLKFPSCNDITNRLSTLTWAKDLQQIPATVIDSGVLKDVPYNSFKAGDYEVNVYGDPSAPACVEIGIYRTLLNDRTAMKNCTDFMSGILPRGNHKYALTQLHLAKDWMESDGICMEITPPQDEDAYGGWWVSAYISDALNRARASPEEMAFISVPKATASAELSGTPSGWSKSDMKLARPNCKLTEASLESVTIKGREYKNVTLVKRNPAEVTAYYTGGAVRMPIENLSPEHQKHFGYDAKAASVFRAAVRASIQLMVAQAIVGQLYQPGPLYQQAPPQAYHLPPAQTAQNTPTYQPPPVPQPYQPAAYQSQQPQSYNTGAVYVRGYYRSNGTYVHAHTRSR